MVFNSILHYPHIPLNSKLRRLFLSRILRTAAVTFLTLFSSIHIYQLAQAEGISHSYSIVIVALFYLFLFVAKFFGLFWGENISQSIGLKKTLRLSIIPFTVLIVILMFSQSIVMILVGAVAWGLHAGLFWWAYHAYFVSVGDSVTFGSDVGRVIMYDTLVAFLTPLAGAVFIAEVGFSVSYLIAYVIAVISIIAIGAEDDVVPTSDVKMGEIVRNVFKKLPFTIGYLGIAGEGVAYNIVWPLFVY